MNFSIWWEALFLWFIFEQKSEDCPLTLCPGDHRCQTVQKLLYLLSLISVSAGDRKCEDLLCNE